MNANLLADILDVEWDRNGRKSFIAEAATMLRQQQAEIANLKAGLLSHHDIYPVKELTDEEIIKLFDSYEFSDEGVVEFAHELLRKAQEK